MPSWRRACAGPSCCSGSRRRSGRRTISSRVPRAAWSRRTFLPSGRWSVALALLLPLVARDLARSFARWRGEWRQMLVPGALGMWICGAFVYRGGESTSATNISLIYAASPVGIALAGRWLLHEAATPAQRAGMVVALLGVLTVISRGQPRKARACMARGEVWDAWRLHRNIYERRIRSKSIRCGGCADLGVSGIWRARAAAPVWRARYLPDRRDTSRVQQDCAHGRTWAAGAAHCCY